ncbi:MAG: aromatic-ring-hydroxylating dioxygenase subunit beta [Halioglobus sp.]|nr:aromatic-ring-hydroxylating dioxygenase subunit beta [Halioglobus sp.]
MSALALEVSAEEQRGLERFYFYEARLLDNRQYQQWLALLSEELHYVIPSRVNVQVDNRARGSEAMISVERELEGVDSLGVPLREENIFHLAMRVERAYKINSWSENPPARTRRLVGNIEVMGRPADCLEVLSNFHLYHARPGSANFLYSGQRRDTLRRQDDSYLITQREVILDYADIDLPTVGLFF